MCSLTVLLLKVVAVFGCIKIFINNLKYKKWKKLKLII